MSLMNLLRRGLVSAGDLSYTYETDFESMTVGQRPTPSIANAGVGNFGWNDTQSPRVSNEWAQTGTNSLKFTYAADPTPQESSSQQSFGLGRSLGEFWFDFWWRVPSNYAHRNVGGAGPTSKLFQIWKGAYSDPSVKWGVSFNRVNDGLSSFYPTATRGNEPDVTQAPVQNYPSAFDKDHFIGASGIIVPGTSNHLKFHFKPASSRTATDGIWKMWVGDTLYMNGGGRLWTPVEAIGTAFENDVTVDNGYLMGSSNAGFAVETVFYIDKPRWTNVNPGW